MPRFEEPLIRWTLYLAIPALAVMVAGSWLVAWFLADLWDGPEHWERYAREKAAEYAALREVGHAEEAREVFEEADGRIAFRAIAYDEGVDPADQIFFYDLLLWFRQETVGPGEKTLQATHGSIKFLINHEEDGMALERCRDRVDLPEGEMVGPSWLVGAVVSSCSEAAYGAGDTALYSRYLEQAREILDADAPEAAGD